MGTRPGLTKAKIIVKAIAIADKDGLNALSMRKLAGALHVQAMSLYFHFPAKDDLICQMADRLITDIEFGDPAVTDASDWRTIMIHRTVSAKALFQKHPWLPQVIDSQIQSGTKRLEYLNHYIGTLRTAGFPIDLALKVTSLLDSYLYGYCRQLTHVADADKTSEELAEEFSNGFLPTDYPFLSEATALVMEQGYDADADFQFGLNVLLNGIELELQQRKGSDSTPS